MDQEEEKSCLSKLRDKVRSQDSFGIPVQLNLRKEATHNTFLGGCCTIMAVLVMLAFIAGELIQLCFTNNYSSGYQVDYLKYGHGETVVYSLTPEQFTIGFSVIDRNESVLPHDELEKIIGFYYLSTD